MRPLHDLAVTEGANAVSRLKAIPASAERDPQVLHGFDTLFIKIDARIADVIEEGIKRYAYFTRVKVPRIVDNSGQMVAPPRERYIPLGQPEHTATVELVRRQLRPIAEPSPAPPGAAESRADLHAAIVHRPSGRSGPELGL